MAAMTGFDPSTPNVARIYDFLLGGKNHYSADRAAAEKLSTLLPDAPHAARENRQFLQRAARYLAREAGIRQFIDIGSGLPTAENTHEAARKEEFTARTVYVDHDPVVIAHGRALLATDENVAAIRGDLRDPQSILDNPDLREVIDLGRPLAIMLVAVLHFLDDASAYTTVNYLKRAIPPGSFIVISHVTADPVEAETNQKARELYNDTDTPIFPRTKEEVAWFFDRLELVEPGMVGVAEWHSGLRQAPTRNIIYGGVARKP
jgi:O-methyltransferase involved in polyketide biosynthesis